MRMTKGKAPFKLRMFNRNLKALGDLFKSDSMPEAIRRLSSGGTRAGLVMRHGS
jgi:hypothetical protein